ncbi:MAG: protein kinase [Pseudomonadales bacterium]|nr:protein kinase [Pseudomonadales bacterium]
MVLTLSEGQSLGQFTLVQKIATSAKAERWLALDNTVAERVCLRIFAEPLTAEVRAGLEDCIARYRGILHPNIVRNRALETVDGTDILISAWVRGGKPAELNSPPQQQWPMLQTLFSALHYLHESGVAHGRLTTANLLIDDQQQIHITDPGLPAAISESQASPCLSPQISAGHRPDQSDDIYALGALLFRLLTQQDYAPGKVFESSTPVPAEVKELVLAMLAPQPFDRPRQISTIEDILGSYLDPERQHAGGSLDTGSFSRASATPEQPALTVQRLPYEKPGVSTGPVVIGLAAVILLAAGVFLWLPDASTGTTGTEALSTESNPGSNQGQTKADPALNTTSPPAETATTESAAPTLTPMEIARLEQLKADSQTAATTLLRLQVALEDQGARIWAPTAFQQIADAGTTGDVAYREDRIDDAFAAYQAGIDAAEALLARIPEVAASNRDKGLQALEAGDSQSALEAFTLLNAIYPDDEEIDYFLQRATRLDDVIVLTDNAQAAENAGDPDSAGKGYEAALALDPDWALAQAGLARVSEQQALRIFNNTMSAGFAALSGQDFDAAENAFRRAKKLRPDSPAVADGLQQLQAARTAATVSTLQVRATEAMAREDWQQAITIFEEVLATDPTVIFATEGLQKATERLQLKEALLRLTERPELMKSDEELEAARKLVVSAARISERGDQLRALSGELSQLIAMARVPQTLTVTSDNQTEVMIYKVANLGQIEQHQLELIPGDYTIVGRRRGYKDVREDIVIRGGKNPLTVNISCSERI